MSSNNGLISSAIDAFRPSNVIMKIVFMIITITALSITQLIYYLDLAGQKGASWWTALIPAYKEGLAVIFASVWTFIVELATFSINTNNYGTLFFGILFTLGAYYVLYQPVTLFLDVVDMRTGEHSSVLVKVMATVIMVVIVSAIVYYSGGADSVLSGAKQVSENVTLNNTSNISQSPVIDMLG